MGVIAQYYPVGIGQAYCLYRRRHAVAQQTACRGEPRTPYLFFCGKKRYTQRNEIINSEMSNILRKERTKLRQIKKQK